MATVATSLLLRGGLVATAAGQAHEDVLVEGALIAARGPRLAAPADAELVDASGLVLLPGGVDELVHLVEPIGPDAPADDMASGTVAAATGGTTTVVVPADDPADVHRRAAGNAFVDWAVLQRGMPDGPPDPAVAGVLLELDGRERLPVEAALDVLLAARQARLPVTVHGIAGATADVLARRSGGDHAALRPSGAECALLALLADWAGLAGTTAHVVPVPSAAVADALGSALTGSTSLAHLCLSSTPADALLVPPHRGATDGLWAALADGRLQGVASDHRPPSLRRQPDMAPHVGIAAAALRLPLLHADGVAAGRIDLPRLAALTAELPARRLGLWPRKGSLDPGADADLVLLDPAARWTVESARVEGRGRAPAWDGRELAGRVQSVLARGDWVVRDGTVLFRPGRGRPVAAGPATR